ncbi:MAG: hypothetical protein M0Z87_04625 [Actinomycetota bacterium]|nr:hypothetical protein [Actinomycetota bacterium]
MVLVPERLAVGVLGQDPQEVGAVLLVVLPRDAADDGQLLAQGELRPP